MKDLIIKGTQQKPDVYFSAEKGELNISGQSIPENAMLLFEPILNWVNEYKKSPAEKTTLTFKMKYYNTASSKMFFTIIKELNNLHKLGINVAIDWYYQSDDEDMLDAGEYFKDLIEMPFNFIVYD